jgi:hypothetical protein
MFKTSEILIDAFVGQLRQTYGAVFGSREQPDYPDLLAEIGRIALNRIARSNALYHDLDHTMKVTLVGQDILQGRIIRDGDVSPADWLHFVASLLCFSIGFVRDICPGDGGNRCVVDESGRTVELPRGATDGYLWPYAADRGRLFVRARFRGHPMIDPEILAATIDYARFPPPPDRNLETDNYGGLLRAAHFIGAAADPSFMAKLKPLYLEMQESGVIPPPHGSAGLAEFRAGYAALFWSTIHRLTRDGAEFLKFTASGRQWLANMYAQVLAEEHLMPAMGATRMHNGGAGLRAAAQ